MIVPLDALQVGGQLELAQEPGVVLKLEVGVLPVLLQLHLAEKVIGVD